MKYALLNGRLAMDPTVTRENDKVFARFGLIVDDGYKPEGATENSTSLFNMTANGSTADFIEKYLKQGAKVLCQCEPRSNDYTDKNGNTVKSVSFHITRIEFEETKAERERREQAKAAQNAAANPMGIPQGNMNISAGMQGYAAQNVMPNMNPNMGMDYQMGQVMNGMPPQSVPVMSMNPVMPTNPVNPVNPTTPVMPTNPVIPTAPSNPVMSTAPAYTSNPADAANNFVNMPTNYNDAPVGLPFN